MKFYGYALQRWGGQQSTINTKPAGNEMGRACTPLGATPVSFSFSFQSAARALPLAGPVGSVG